jgi:hypothetical protein
MLDIPGGHGKIPIGPAFVRNTPKNKSHNGKEWIVEDYRGCLHSYSESGEAAVADKTDEG